MKRCSWDKAGRKRKESTLEAEGRWVVPGMLGMRLCARGPWKSLKEAPGEPPHAYLHYPRMPHMYCLIHTGWHDTWKQG